MNMTMVSVIIPVHNGGKTISGCLASVLQQTDVDFEVVVVDNASTDDTPNILDGFFDPKIVRVFEPVKSRGAARHTGVAHAKGEIIAMIDADCIAPARWLSQLIGPIMNGQAYVVVGGEYDLADNYWSRHIQNENGETIARALKDEVYVDHLDTKNFAIRADLVKKIQFDREMACLEDLDFKLRLHEKITYLPQTKVGHHHQNSSIGFIRSAFERGFWAVKVFQKNRNADTRHEPMFITMSVKNFITSPAWLLWQLLSRPFDRALFTIVSEAAWRCGVLSAVGRQTWARIIRADISSILLRPLFRIKIGKYRWGHLRQTVYQDINRHFSSNGLPQSTKSKLQQLITKKTITKISVVVATRNRLVVLRQYALASLLAQNCDQVQLEIVIADNNSQDGTWQYLQSLADPRITIVKVEAIGVSASRNAGIRLATGEIVAFIDDDCLVDPHWLSRMYENYQKGDYLMGQGRIWDEAWGKYLNGRELFDADQRSEKFYKQFYEGNMSFRREIFEFVSFNEQMIYGNEGYDLLTQIEIFWPQFSFFYDPIAIKHFRCSSEYRTARLGRLNKKGLRLDIKLFGLWCVNTSILRRNINTAKKYFPILFWMREIAYWPCDLFMVFFDLPLLFKTKVRIYRQLLKVRLI